MSEPVTPRQRRIADLRRARARLEAELLVLESDEDSVKVKKKRGEKPPCGTEQGYQSHAHFGDTEANGYRVNCVACRKAHADHERVASARRRLEAS